MTFYYFSGWKESFQSRLLIFLNVMSAVTPLTASFFKLSFLFCFVFLFNFLIIILIYSHVDVILNNL